MAKTATLKQGRIHARPICAWCSIDLDLQVDFVTIDPALGLPAGVGLRVCTPACPQRPESATVIRRGQEGF